MDAHQEKLSPGSTTKRKGRGRRLERNAERTKERILSTAKAEFCKHGFSGARVERIAKNSKSNMRMIYHYYGNKKGLYISVLESVYIEIRSRERELDLEHSAPLDGMIKLIEFTFDFFLENRHYLALIGNENMLRAHYLKQVRNVHNMATPLIDSIRDLLDRGGREGKIRTDLDPVQLYVSIVALSQLHLMSRFTLSVIFDQNLEDPAWIAERRAYVLSVLLDHLTKGCAQST